jgi:hypothetical protein
VKTKYQIYLVDPDTGQPTLHNCWGKHARFDVPSQAEHMVAELERVYPGTAWQIREVARAGAGMKFSEVPERYWSMDLNKWVTASLTAPM